MFDNCCLMCEVWLLCLFDVAICGSHVFCHLRILFFCMRVVFDGDDADWGMFLICCCVKIGNVWRKPVSMALQRVLRVGLKKLVCKKQICSALPGWCTVALVEWVGDCFTCYNPGGHCVPCNITLFFLYEYSFVLVRWVWQPALHNWPNNIGDPDTSCGKTCTVCVVCGSSGMRIFATCVEMMVSTFGSVAEMGVCALVALCRGPWTCIMC